MINTIAKLYNRTRTEVPFVKVDDIVTHKEIWALSLEVTGYTGDLIQVVRSSDSATFGVGALANGKLNVDAMIAFIGANTGYVSIVYGQKLFDDLVATVGNRPIIINAGTLETLNGEPAILFDGISDYFTSSLPYTATTNPLVVSVLYSIDTLGINQGLIGSGWSGGRGLHSFINSSNIKSSKTYRTATTELTETTALNINESYLSSSITDRVNIHGYRNGSLNSTITDTNTDFIIDDVLTVGNINGSVWHFSGKMQYISVAQVDTSANQTAIYDLLESKYNISGTYVHVPTYEYIETAGEYFSDFPMYTTGFEAQGRLVGDINFNQQMYFLNWNRSQSGLGNVDIVNIDSEHNSLVTSDYNRIEVFKYDVGTITSFGIADIDNIGYIEKGRIRVSVKSVLSKLETNLPTQLFNASYPNSENERQRYVLGECYLVEPVIVDATTNKYFVSDGATIVTVYDRGISVGFTQVTDGFTLTANPNGKILVVALGFTAETHISDHIPRLLEYVDFDIVTADLTAIYPAIDSCWSGTDETVSQAIKELIDGFNCYMYVDTSNQLRFGKLALPVSPTDTLEEWEIIGEIKAFKDRAKNISDSMSNNRNFNQFDDIVYTALEADKVGFVKEYKKTAVGTGLNAYYQYNNPPQISQSLGGIANAQTIINDKIALYSSLRFFYDLSTVREFNLNQVITVTNNLKGLEGGKDLLVIGKNKHSSKPRIEYTLWG